MNCIIIDDEAASRSIVSHYCSQLLDLQVEEEFTNAIDAIKFLNKRSVDLVFLDIHMPGFTGMDLIETLKNPPHVILITSDPDFAIDAFDFDCIVDYLVKPIMIERFEKAVTKTRYRRERTKTQRAERQDLAPTPVDGEMFVKVNRKLIKIDFSSMSVIQAKGDYVLIKTDGEEYKVHTTLKKVQEKLPEAFFFKAHRSYIINFRKIIDIQDSRVLIANKLIPISRTNRAELMDRLNVL